MAVTVETLTGTDLKRALPELAKLRIMVFRDWPYLYDGTLAHEQDYLTRFGAACGAMIAAAWDNGRIIGAATAAPLSGHTEEFVPLFERAGFDPDKIFYFGESVLLSDYRGRRLGHAFFDHREQHARASSGAAGAFSHTGFCGVVRPDEHPLKPAGYRPLDAFWAKRGYVKVDGLVGSYTWQDIGQPAETAKPMQFWVRPL